MNCIIVADKFQKRMKSKGCIGLVKDKNITIIDKQCQILSQVFPTLNISYVYGFDNKRLENYTQKKANFKNVSFVYNEMYDHYNTIYSLYLASYALKDDCLIIFGNNSLSKKIFNRFDKNDGSQIFLSDNSSSSLGCIIDNNIIQNISYGLNNTLSEIYFLNKQNALCLKKLIETQNFHQYFLFELINMLIDYKHIIRYHKHK